MVHVNNLVKHNVQLSAELEPTNIGKENYWL